MRNNFLKFSATAIICLCGFSTISQANQGVYNEEYALKMLDAAQAQAKLYKPVWQQLYTCTPAKTNDGALIVYGKTSNNKCSFKLSKYNCNLPFETNREYAAAGIKSLEDIEQGNITSSSPENEYMEKIHNNPLYCTIK